MSEFPRFLGNCPKNVSKDAKYVIRRNPEGGRRAAVVALTYRTADEEKWHMSTDQHPRLVEMVNAVKTSVGHAPNGAFYINEFHQVIVPSVGEDNYYLAGTYEQPLEFEFEGNSISGRPVSLDGRPLSPGDLWNGPHAGIPYVLKAGAKDIRYNVFIRPRVETEVKLSKAIGAERALRVAHRIQGVKGYEGGRFYVNEFRSIFAPLQHGYELKYVYIGQLDMNEWFQAPTGERRT